MINKYSTPAQVSYRPLNLGVIADLTKTKDAEYKGVLGKGYEAGDSLHFKTGMLTEDWAKPMQQEYQGQISEAMELLKSSGNPTLAAEKLAQIQNKLSQDERVRVMNLDSELSPHAWNIIQQNQSGYFDWYDAKTNKTKGMPLPEYGKELNPDLLYNTYGNWAGEADFIKDYGPSFLQMDPEDVNYPVRLNKEAGTIELRSGEIKNVYDWLSTQDIKGGKSIMDMLKVEFQNRSTNTARNYSINPAYGEDDQQRFDKFVEDYLDSIQVLNSEEYQVQRYKADDGSGGSGGTGFKIPGANQFVSDSQITEFVDLSKDPTAYLTSNDAINKLQQDVKTGKISIDSPEYAKAVTNANYYKFINDKYNNSFENKQLVTAEQKYYNGIPDNKRAMTVNTSNGETSIAASPDQLNQATSLLNKVLLTEMIPFVHDASITVALSPIAMVGMVQRLDKSLQQILGVDEASVIYKGLIPTIPDEEKAAYLVNALIGVNPMKLVMGQALSILGGIVDLDAMGLAKHAEFQSGIDDRREKSFKESASDFGLTMSVVSPINVEDKDLWNSSISQVVKSKAVTEVVINQGSTSLTIPQEDAYAILEQLGTFINSPKFDATKGFGLADDNKGGALFFSGIPLIYDDGELRPPEEGESGGLSILLPINQQALITNQATAARTLVGLFDMTLDDTGKLVPGVLPNADPSRLIETNIVGNHLFDAALSGVVLENSGSAMNQKETIAQALANAQIAFQASPLSGTEITLNPKYTDASFLQLQYGTWGIPNSDGTKLINQGVVIRYGESSASAKQYTLQDSIEALLENDPTTNMNLLGDYATRMVAQYRTANLLTPTAFQDVSSKLNNNTLTVSDLTKAVGYSDSMKANRMTDLEMPFYFKDKQEAILMMSDSKSSSSNGGIVEEGVLSMNDQGIPDNTISLKSIMSDTRYKHTDNTFPFIHKDNGPGIKQLALDYESVFFTDAYRPKKVNENTTGSAENSDHLKGKALDVRYNDAGKKLYKDYTADPEGFSTKYKMKQMFPHTVEGVTHYHVSFL